MPEAAPLGLRLGGVGAYVSRLWARKDVAPSPAEAIPEDGPQPRAYVRVTGSLSRRMIFIAAGLFKDAKRTHLD